MTTLPNGKPIDMDMLETAMQDSDLTNRYFLNLETGEVAFLSDYLGPSEESEQMEADIEGTNKYIAVERISSHEAYQWMVDFVEQAVAPVDAQLAEKLSIALDGKGAFSRFKNMLHSGDERWLQAWYQWEKIQLTATVIEWLEAVLQ